MDTLPLWLTTVPRRTWPRLEGDLEVDVAIAGAGVTGITAAYLLMRAGQKVALLESRRVLDGETGHTTAHLTEILDSRYHALKRAFGLEGAALARRGSREAIDLIGTLAGSSAEYRKVPA